MKKKAPAGPTERWVSPRERRRLAREEALRASLDDLYRLRDVPPPLSDPDDDGFSWAPEGWSSGS